MDTLLKFLSGKKWVIATILSLILWFLFAKWLIDDLTFTLIGWILTALFGWASIATKSMYNK